MRSRLSKPKLGLSVQQPFCEAGETSDPAVSVPIVTVANFAEAAEPLPELDPPPSNLPTAFFVCPPSTVTPFQLS